MKTPRTNAPAHRAVTALVLVVLAFVVPSGAAIALDASVLPAVALAAHSPSADAAVTANLAAVERALARNDALAAWAALQDAYQAALASRHWHAMLEYADTAVRVGSATGERQQGVERARRAYLLALYRARAEGSLDGALAVATAFGNLGDRDVALGCLTMAERLARTDTDRARVHAATAGVNERLLARVKTY